MTTSVLHYICDPLCGWCYGATPLVDAAEAIPDLKFELHCGGLFSAPNTRTIGADMRAFIMQHDQRMTALTGQGVGDAYVNGLLCSGDAKLDSTPPARAVLAAEKIAGKGLQLFKAIQRGHWMEGRRVAEVATLEAIAREQGLALEPFRAGCAALSDQDMRAHIQQSRMLLQQHGGAGFPCFVLEHNGRQQRLDHERHYGNPAAWRRYLESALA